MNTVSMVHIRSPYSSITKRGNATMEDAQIEKVRVMFTLPPKWGKLVATGTPYSQ
jgi:hypothetical protein